MDALCNGVKKPEGSDTIVDPRPPPAKLARLEQNGAGPSAQERSRQGSPVAKNHCLVQKPTAVRPQGKSWHSRGTWADAGKGFRGYMQRRSPVGFLLLKDCCSYTYSEYDSYVSYEVSNYCHRFTGGEVPPLQ